MECEDGSSAEAIQLSSDNQSFPEKTNSEQNDLISSISIPSLNTFPCLKTKHNFLLLD
jgi:hypothetical protein